MSRKKDQKYKKDQTRDPAEATEGEVSDRNELADAAFEGEPEETGPIPEAVEPNSGEAFSITPEEAARLARERDEYYDRLLRTQADFDNYRKRVQKDQANLLKYGAERAVAELLPVVDNLERAVESARTHGDSNSQLREGVDMILGQFRDVLEKLGLRPIESVGHPFDPNKHDALLRVYAPNEPEGSIVDEIRKGYYLHDKVLRPAQVTVGTHEHVHEDGGSSGGDE